MPAIPHWRKLSLYTALSVTDLVLTWFLLKQPGGGAYEWNPIAAWWLSRFGWWGLAQLKLGVVLLTAALALVVSVYRPRAAGRMLTFGCGVLASVLFYSGLLVPDVLSAASRAGQNDVPSQLLERRCADFRDYTSVLYKLGRDLAYRRCSLAEAMDLLAATEAVRGQQWQQRMAIRFPGYQGAEVLGALLIEEAILSTDADLSWLAERYRQLDAEFQSCFHRPGPLPSVLRHHRDRYQHKLSSEDGRWPGTSSSADSSNDAVASWGSYAERRL
jgi:hypothetical protein